MADHVPNRGNGGATVFHKDGDYTAFFDLLAIAKATYPVTLFGVCLMPTPFHLVVQPATDARTVSLRLHTCVNRQQPSGTADWQARIAALLGLTSTLRPLGRPRKSPEKLLSPVPLLGCMQEGGTRDDHGQEKTRAE